MAAKSFKRDQHHLIDEIWDQVDNLQAQCRQFGGGLYTIYKSISVILRTLLLGSSGQPPLLMPVLPDVSFFPLASTPVKPFCEGPWSPAEIVVTNDASGSLHYCAGSTMQYYLASEDGGVVLSRNDPIEGDVLRRIEVKNLFNPMGHRLSLEDWLAQPFLGIDWTLRDFLKCIVHKDGGAHLDQSAKVDSLRKFGYIHWHLTAMIAKYAAGEIASHLERAYPNHTRPIR